MTLTVVGGKRKRVNHRPAKVRAHAVGIAMAEGVTEAERQTGIPKETVHYWLQKPEFAHLRTTARETVAADFWAGVQIGIDEVSKGLRDPGVPLKDKAAALGVVYDRYALLTGLVTSRSETRATSDGMDDHEKAALRAVLDQVMGSESVAGIEPASTPVVRADPEPAESLT